MATETEADSDRAIRGRSGAYDRVFSIASSVLYDALVYGAIVFLLAPLAIVVIMSFQSSAYAGWPPGSFTLKWYTGLPEQFRYLGIIGPLRTSLVLAVATGVVSTTVGGLAAFSIVRYDFKYSTTLETLMLSPLIYPWIVIGLALLLFINAIGVKLTFWTLLVGHLLFTLPYPIRTIGASLQNFPASLEEAATNLGATDLESYVLITIPLVRPGIVSGFIFAFILSFNQYIVSLFLSGPSTKTVPLLLFSLFYNTSPAQLASLGTLLMSGILVLVFIAEYTVGISEFL